MYASPLDLSRPLLVAVIDIGTSQSGIAYSFTAEYEKNPLQVAVPNWFDDHGDHDTTPTCALFTTEKKFKAFGFDAQSQYREHVDENTHTDVYYFKRVIVDLFKNEVNGEFLLEDQTGKKMSSMDVLIACIQYLRDRFTDTLKARVVSLMSSDIRWVLPVPVSWNNKSISFMRTAAVNAGIPNEHILIVKESEAAFRYCSLQNDEINKSSAGHPPWQERHFLLLNVNHFAVDITVHRAQLNSHILELHNTKVDNFGNTPLEQLLADMFCSDVMDSYIDTHDFEYNGMKQEYGGRFIGIMPPTVQCFIQPSLLSHFESKRGITFADHLTACYGGGIQIKSDKLRIKTELLKPKLRKIYEHIVSSMQRTLEIFHSDLSAIIIIGKFSEYPMLHDVIKEAFPDKQIIVPTNTESTVLGGAVIYGHQVLSGKKKSKLFSQH